MTSVGVAPSEQRVLYAVLRQDLGAFINKVFTTVSPGDTYAHNWHIDAITYSLPQVHRGLSRRLIITATADAENDLHVCSIRGLGTWPRSEQTICLCVI